MKIYASNNSKVYTYKGYKFYVDNTYNAIAIERIDNEEDYYIIESLPTELIKFSSVRHAIYCGYVNYGGDLRLSTICGLLRESAPYDQLFKIEEIMQKHRKSIWRY